MHMLIFYHSVQANVDQCIFSYYIATIQTFVIKMPYINFQIFSWMLMSSLSSMWFCFDTKHFVWKKESRCYRSWTEPGFWFMYKVYTRSMSLTWRIPLGTNFGHCRVKKTHYMFMILLLAFIKVLKLRNNLSIWIKFCYNHSWRR